MKLGLYLKKNEVIKYLLGTFLLSWIVWGVLIASYKGIIDKNLYRHHMMAVIFVGGVVPSIFAIIYVGLTDGKDGVIQLLKKITIWKINPLWYVFSIGFMYIVIYAPAIICNLFGNYYDIKLRYEPLYILYLFTGQLFGGPFNEEFGWRGFVLPRLQRKFNPLLAAIVLGIVHAAWHLPLFVVYNNEPFGQYFIKVIITSIFYTWIYNRTKGSLIPAVLFHANYNFVMVPFIMTTITPTPMYGNLVNVFASVLVIFVAWHMLRNKDKKVVDTYVNTEV